MALTIKNLAQGQLGHISCLFREHHTKQRRECTGRHGGFTGLSCGLCPYACARTKHLGFARARRPWDGHCILAEEISAFPMPCF